MLPKAPLMLPSLSWTQEEYRNNRIRVNLKGSDAGVLLFQKHLTCKAKQLVEHHSGRFRFGMSTPTSLAHS